MRVLFWGTSAFAGPSLRALLGEGFDVCGVITQPDRARGRSRSTLVASPIKEIAIAESIPVLQPEKPRGREFMDHLRALEPELSVVVSYGHILHKDIIDLPQLGTVNVHGSLLPKLRGAAPIQAAIREGFIETGVTIMRMVPALDAGPIVLQARTPIAEDETAGELELRLSELGALALIEALTLISLGETSERPHNYDLATFAPKIERDMARIAWRKETASSHATSARTIPSLVRSPSRWRSAQAFWGAGDGGSCDEGSTKAVRSSASTAPGCWSLAAMGRYASYRCRPRANAESRRSSSPAGVASPSATSWAMAARL